ncbi:MAG: hypothetical protein JWQ71_1434 [Pedosphaera sp.]|nr:hypothetical protein [Pedosphaera sp.]
MGITSPSLNVNRFLQVIVIIHFVFYTVQYVPAVLTIVIKSVQKKVKEYLKFSLGSPKRAQGGLFTTGLLCLILALVPACRTMPALPPVNLSEPGWTVLQGQGVWRMKKEAPEIAGEILVATNSNGRSMMQFIKTPLPFVTAQTTTNSWQIHFVPNDKTYSGRGKAPTGLAARYMPHCWFYLPSSLAGAPPPKPWSWQQLPDGAWRLENSRTGEALEGYLNP